MLNLDEIGLDLWSDDLSKAEVVVDRVYDFGVVVDSEHLLWGVEAFDYSDIIGH